MNHGISRSRRLMLLSGAFVAALGLAEPPTALAQDTPVDLALVLAIDVSFSVDANEFRQQMQGLASAFHQRDLQKAIRNGTRGRIAVAAIQWSDETGQSTIVPWRIVAS